MIRVEQTKATENIYRSIFSVTELALDLVRTYTPDNRKDRDDAYASIKRISHTQKFRCQTEYINYYTSQEELYKFIRGVHLENARQLFYRVKIVIEKNMSNESDIKIHLEKIRTQLIELAEEESKILVNNI